MSTTGDVEREVERFQADFEALEREIGKLIVGQDDVIRGVVTALVAGGHVLLEGLPGMGKTALARALAEVTELSFQRIQCTPDLMPTDVIGTYVIMETPQGRRSFEFQKGPLFSNVVLAEHVNRTTPKTQSALLEAMEEPSITVSTESFALPEPFFLVATQNPLEMEGTYPLPEAQIDRFFFKLVVRRPGCEELEQILDRTTAALRPVVRPVVGGARIGEMGEFARGVAIAAEIRRFATAVVTATHPDDQRAPQAVRRYVRYGASPRGAQAMVLAAKIRAVVDGRYHASIDDLREACHAALRHRIILNYEGQAENVEPDAILDDVLQSVAQSEGAA
ncbi:MAG: AAA family ATPase [Planctomycetota bacterium]|jgi:MoxR-like ATPase